MKIIYMGTPDFAAVSLNALLDAGYDVAAVFTQPDKPKGRGHKLAFSPVKEIAVAHNIPVYQPTTLKNEEVQQQIREMAPDMIVVVAYGKLLPEAVLNVPPLGCINVHGSLLPKYRGAAPIQWSVLNGDKETGITTMYMAKGMDTGDIILQEKTPIGEDETAAELFDRMAVLGAETLLKTIPLLQAGTAPRIPQNEAEASHVSMLSKEQAQIDFSKTADEVHHFICGMSDWPCAFTSIGGKRLKVYRSHRTALTSKQSAGSVVENKKVLTVVCGDGNCVELTEVQYDNGKRMPSDAFLRGHAVEIGTVLGEA